MKRCTLVFMLILLTAPLAAAQNLLVNGSFDDLIFHEPSGGTSIPDGWRRYTFGGSDGTYVVPGGDAVHGPNYVQVGVFNSLVQVTTATIAPNTTYNLAAFARSFGAGPYDVRVYAVTDPLEVLYVNSTEIGRVQYGLPPSPSDQMMTEKTTQFTPAAEHVGKFMGVYIAAHAGFYGFDNVRLTAVAPAGDADFDGDNDVDGNDFLIWQRGLGTPSPTQMQGNANSDTAVDGVDLEIWKTQFGTATAVAAASAIPEPASVMLLIFGSALALGTARRPCRMMSA